MHLTKVLEILTPGFLFSHKISVLIMTCCHRLGPTEFRPRISYCQFPRHKLSFISLDLIVCNGQVPVREFYSINSFHFSVLLCIVQWSANDGLVPRVGKLNSPPRNSDII